MLPRQPVSVQKRYLLVSTGSKKGLASGHKLDLTRGAQNAKKQFLYRANFEHPITQCIGYSLRSMRSLRDLIQLARYKRYIDDGFGLWTGTLKTMQGVALYVNQIHKNIMY